MGLSNQRGTTDMSVSSRIKATATSLLELLLPGIDDVETTDLESMCYTTPPGQTEGGRTSRVDGTIAFLRVAQSGRTQKVCRSTWTIAIPDALFDAESHTRRRSSSVCTRHDLNAVAHAQGWSLSCSA